MGAAGPHFGDFPCRIFECSGEKGVGENGHSRKRALALARCPLERLQRPLPPRLDGNFGNAPNEEEQYDLPTEEVSNGPMHDYESHRVWVATR